MNDDMDEEEVSHILQQGTSEGLFEIASEDENGEARYKLTDYGSAEAMQTIATKGLPFLVYVISVNALSEGKTDRTVKSMADEAISKFPNKLKRLAKTNFPEFWNKFASAGPELYVNSWREAEDKKSD